MRNQKPITSFRITLLLELLSLYPFSTVQFLECQTAIQEFLTDGSKVTSALWAISEPQYYCMVPKRVGASKSASKPLVQGQQVQSTRLWYGCQSRCAFLNQPRPLRLVTDAAWRPYQVEIAWHCFQIDRRKGQLTECQKRHNGRFSIQSSTLSSINFVTVLCNTQVRIDEVSSEFKCK